MIKNSFSDDETVLIIEKYDSSAFPIIEIDYSKHIDRLNTKYSQKLCEISNKCDDFEAVVKKMNNHWENEINALITYCSQSELWIQYLTNRKKGVINRSQFEDVGFSIEDNKAHLLWYSDALILYLSDYANQIHPFPSEDSNDREAASFLALFPRLNSDLYTAYILALFRQPLSWINIEELHLDDNWITDAGVSQLVSM